MRLFSLLLVFGCSSPSSHHEDPAPPEPTAAALTEPEPAAEPTPARALAEPAEPAAPRADAAPDDPCPVLSSDSAGSGLAPSVNGENIDTDVDALAAALPERVGSLRRSGEASSWARGDAGHWSPGASAAYPYEDDEITIQIDDLVHVCTCAAGMGEALQQRRIVELAGANAREIAGHPAVSSERPELGAKVTVWVNDRCSVTVSGYTPAERIETTAGALDWAAIAAACPTREP